MQLNLMRIYFKMEFLDLIDRKEECIICPYCKHEQDTETEHHNVTYWGDDGDHKKNSCEHCGKDFFVAEMVTRQWATYKLEEESK